MDLLATMGMYEKKTLPVMSILPLAGSYVGYIVLSNLRCTRDTTGWRPSSAWNFSIRFAPGACAHTRRHTL